MRRLEGLALPYQQWRPSIQQRISWIGFGIPSRFLFRSDCDQPACSTLLHHHGTVVGTIRLGAGMRSIHVPATNTRFRCRYGWGRCDLATDDSITEVFACYGTVDARSLWCYPPLHRSRFRLDLPTATKIATSDI